MKTITPTQLKGDERKWYVIDAQDETLGRLATKIAVILKGKNKASFAPHIDNGDYVIVTNCDKFAVTGKKLTDKMYYRHSGYLGGLKEISLGNLLEKKPTKALELAVFGMLPKNKLRKEMLSRLKLFTGVEHTYVAQKPELIK
ncbi:MAG: 50S ribosomal protein L13 [Candidatus Gracilibacteria bacterium]|nr:50S ribosomal protein L13 [Candidatus Gracilibacteria bacterium]